MTKGNFKFIKLFFENEEEIKKLKQIEKELKEKIKNIEIDNDENVVMTKYKIITLKERFELKEWDSFDVIIKIRKEYNGDTDCNMFEREWIIQFEDYDEIILPRREDGYQSRVQYNAWNVFDGGSCVNRSGLNATWCYKDEESNPYKPEELEMLKTFSDAYGNYVRM